jgi:hypothetical protein
MCNMSGSLVLQNITQLFWEISYVGGITVKRGLTLCL